MYDYEKYKISVDQVYISEQDKNHFLVLNVETYKDLGHAVVYDMNAGKRRKMECSFLACETTIAT